MDYLQYLILGAMLFIVLKVLNLIINGLPSIRDKVHANNGDPSVLNLIINGLPSIQK